ncbi:MAG: response regulator [Alphaproteobacteria bacterium]|nr:MAG: response regulator [Alphaproteobacteria bacterium]
MEAGKDRDAAGRGRVNAMLGTRRPIAVVDDNSDDQFFLRRELNFLFGEMPVIAFPNGAALLHYLQDHFDEERPWLILLDLHMAGMDGFRTLEFLHGRKGMNDIPVVVVSGTLDRREVQAAFGYGAKAFLPKPISRWDFIKILNGNFKPHQATRR